MNVILEYPEIISSESFYNRLSLFEAELIILISAILLNYWFHEFNGYLQFVYVWLKYKCSLYIVFWISEAGNLSAW